MPRPAEAVQQAQAWAPAPNATGGWNTYRPAENFFR
jgi:hypothetical protein